MAKFVLRVMKPCSGDVEFESGLWATTREEAMVEALSSLNAEVLEVEDDERPCPIAWVYLFLQELLERRKQDETRRNA